MEPKEEIFTALNALGYYCALNSEAVSSQVPAITFTISDSTPRYGLDRSEITAEVVATVDLWADENETLATMADEVEEAMRKINYLCTWSSDIPNPEGSYYHYQLRFGGFKN